MSGIQQMLMGASYASKISLWYLVIGGGGGGGGGVGVENGSGGGAGGMIEQLVDDISDNLFTITVGAGGSAGLYSGGYGGNGGNSILTNGSWFTATAIGGGGGTYYNAGSKSGGSGGGPHGGALQPSQTGYSWGYGNIGTYHASGGGAGGTGSGETGGPGRASIITGASIVYAIGGGGSNQSAWSYGGGGNAPDSHGNGQAGKTGIVRLRVSKPALSYTGSPWVAQIGSDWLYTFVAAGSIQF